jgi:hypothetical protein
MASDIYGLSVGKLRALLKAPDGLTVGITTPLYRTALNDDDVPTVMFPDLLVDLPFTKFQRPTSFLTVSDTGTPLTCGIFVQVQCVDSTPFPPVFLELGPDLLNDANCQNLFSRFLKQFQFQHADPRFMQDDQLIDPNVSVADLFAKAKTRPLVFHCSLSDEARRAIVYRSMILKEILTTEETYVADLKNLIKYWEPAITSHSEVRFAPEEEKFIFCDFVSIRRCHKLFEKAFIARGTDFTCEIGDLFLNYAPLFRAAAGYVSSYQQINELLKRYSQKPKFAAGLLKLSDQNPNKSSRQFGSYLITPVQRIPRYLMFLRELIKNTRPSTPITAYCPPPTSSSRSSSRPWTARRSRQSTMSSSSTSRSGS